MERRVALRRLEAEIRGHSAEARQAVRQKTAAPIVAELFERWIRELARMPRKAKTAEVIRYALPRRAAFERVLHDGGVELKTNIVERAIRPQTTTRKNALFVGSEGGRRTCANLATLLMTAKVNGIDPHAWLTLTLERIAGGRPIVGSTSERPGAFSPQWWRRVRAYAFCEGGVAEGAAAITRLL